MMGTEMHRVTDHQNMMNAYHDHPPPVPRREASRKPRRLPRQVSLTQPLHKWGLWRTNINENIIADIMGDRRDPSINFSSRPPIASMMGHDGPGHRRTGKPIFTYSTATNSGTGLKPTDYMNFGIPRVNIRKKKSNYVNEQERIKMENGVVNGYPMTNGYEDNHYINYNVTSEKMHDARPNGHSRKDSGHNDSRHGGQIVRRSSSRR